MLKTFVGVILIFASSVAVAVSNLPLNPHAPFILEVQSVQHERDTRNLIINLNPSRRCLQPSFRVRLSGTSLYMLDVVKVETDRIIYAYPPLHDDGMYFVEVMAQLCVSFDPDNFASTCLENVANGNNIVTLPYSFQVYANETDKASAEQSPRPRWVLTDKRIATILPTRYQKLGCLSEEERFCPAKASDVWQYDLYNWTDGADYLKPLQEVIAMSRKKTITSNKGNVIRLCSIGDSHSREIADHGNRLGLKNVKFVYIYIPWPYDFEVNVLKDNQCSYSVVTMGQWTASNKMIRHPYNQTRYELEMRRVITLLQKYDHHKTQVFVRSVNYNGLGGRITACPPVDFRSPPVIDMYNGVLSKLCKELNVEYIDLNHIMGPQWDSAEDWCHPVGKVATAETEWILARMLRSSLQRQHRVVLYAE